LFGNLTKTSWGAPQGSGSIDTGEQLKSTCGGGEESRVNETPGNYDCSPKRGRWAQFKNSGHERADNLSTFQGGAKTAKNSAPGGKSEKSTLGFRIGWSADPFLIGIKYAPLKRTRGGERGERKSLD